MDFEEQQRIVRQQRAGFELLRQFEIEKARSASFKDRLDAFARIMGFVELLNRPVSRRDDEDLAQRWIFVRGKYDTKA